MDSIRQFFSYMNDINFEYVVLRNWDGLPYDVTLGEHSDLDLLVSDFNHFFEIFPQAKLEHPAPRVRTRIPIDDSYIYVDVRSVGDDYYPIDFQRAILATRERNPRGFYTPEPMHHRIALAYHAVHHKGGVSREYEKYLGDANVEQLLEALKQSHVGWVEPQDKTVGQYHPYWSGATSIVEKKDGVVIKTQNNYMGYNLISNENKILKSIDSIHFPKCFGTTDNSITLEDCGESLSASNIPQDWESQLSEIVLELARFNVIHRDIRLDNLMVKDGTIKLIDFGWAKFMDSVDEIEPPSCLGFPNKYSDGFSDSYSMRCVKKQIDYMVEEALV